jgi:DNA-directed RNA polymerase specialized sigma24 family protein
MTAPALSTTQWAGHRDVNGQLTADRPARNGSTSRPKRRGRRRQDVENDAYLGFVARVITAAGRRVATGDVDALPDLARLVHDLDTALLTAVTGLRAFGYSWEQIASRLGVTRQAAQQRWGTP